jgi:hypothetical protein
MRKLYFFMLTLILFFAVSNHVQGKTTWTRVTSIDQIESGKIYMLAAYSTSDDKSNGDMEYINYFKPNIEAGYLYNEATNISATEIPPTITTDSTKQYLSVILKQETDGWTVYNTTTHKYNGYSTLNKIDESNICTSNYYWTMSINGNEFVEIENKNSPGIILGYKVTNDTKQLKGYSKTGAGNLPPILYKLTSYDLDEAQDFKESDNIYQIPVTLKRSFTNDTYNSLVLPCEVNDYKAVFGSATTAYELSGYSNDNINFTTVIGNYLSANKPYIISGTFNASPYAIGNAELNKTSKPLSVSNDNKCSYVGNFSKTDLSGKNYYILCNNKFYPCGSQPAPFNILPYHCYFSLSESVKAKIAINGKETTDIEYILYDQKNNNDKYDMNGTKIEDITSYHGVYICNRHKYIR